MKILKILSGLSAKYWKRNDRIVQKELLGVSLKVIDGTIRKEDYDDAWFYLLAKNSSVFFDIGCNIGQTSIVANLTGNIQRIVLVDPNPEAVLSASKNLILNDLASNCSFYTAFVSEASDDSVKFYTVGVGSAGSIFASHAETARLLNSFYYVKTVTIDYLITYYNLIPDLVKIDVEGAEMMVLKGANKLAAHQKSRFIIEMHVTDELSMEKNGDQVVAWAKMNRYRTYFLVDGIEMLNGAPIAHRGRCHVLLQPSTWDYPDFLRDVKEGSPLPKIN